MPNPLSVEDSTDTNYCPTLRQLLETLDENANNYDHLVVALIAIMAEAGFYATQSKDTEQRSMTRSPHIPLNWKSKTTGTYSITFQPHTTTKLECKLVAIPVEGSLVVNLFSMPDCQNMYSAAIPTELYINLYSDGSKKRLTNLRKFSFRFKDSMLTPMRSKYLQKLGVPSPCLMGLPTELQIKILECLRVCDIVRVMQCCHKFYDLVQTSEKFRDKLLQARSYKPLKRIPQRIVCYRPYYYNH